METTILYRGHRFFAFFVVAAMEISGMYLTGGSR